MNKLSRFLSEYQALVPVLTKRDYVALLAATMLNTPQILGTGRLSTLDSAMSRNACVTYRGREVNIPVADIDQLLRQHHDSPTFGNVREIFARDCYLRHLRIDAPSSVLDLGANRGIFSILVLVALRAQLVIGVEPQAVYLPAFERLLAANQCASDRAPRYTRFISNSTIEKTDPEHFVSIQTIQREQKVARFSLVKMDIEGYEKDLFGEPEWLANVDSLTMELHPAKAGDLSVIPEALKHYGFDFIAMDQDGRQAPINSAIFLVASSSPAIARLLS